MATSRSAWIVVGTVTCGLWVALFCAFILPLAIPRQYEDVVLTISVACAMSVFFGSPVLTLFSALAVAGARKRGETIPAFAIWSRNLSMALTGLVLLFVLTTFGFSFVTMRRT